MLASKNEILFLYSVEDVLTVCRALQLGLLTQDMIDMYDPALMFTIPRLAIVRCAVLLVVNLQYYIPKLIFSMIFPVKVGDAYYISVRIVFEFYGNFGEMCPYMRISSCHW